MVDSGTPERAHTMPHLSGARASGAVGGSIVSTDSSGALGSLRILDLSHGVPGGYCTKMLSGLGAEVIKVEPPGGDAVRSAPPFWKDQPHLETGALFLHLNTGKKSITLDLTRPEDADVLRRLVAEADALVESSTPGFMEAHGLSYESLRAINPRLVMTSITPFGQTGPYRTWRGSELVTYAMGGYAHFTGFPEREPIKSYGYIGEYQAGMHASVATLAALWRARGHGAGEYIDVSIRDTVAFIVDAMPERYRQTGVHLTRSGTRNVGSPRTAAIFSEILPCADGYVHAHSPVGPAHHNGIAKMIGEPRWLDPALAETLPPGVDVIDGILQPWIRDKTRADLTRRGQQVNAPWTPVVTIPEVLADPQHEARNFLVDVDHPVVGKVRQPDFHYLMTETPWRTERAPLLGEHNADIRDRVSTEAPRVPAANGERAGAAGGVSPRPLAGVRVLDLSGGVVGPVGGGILADLGVELIRIEQPARVAAQRAQHSALASGFNAHHHDKRHLSLDLRQPEGREVFLRLVKISDVVWENFSPRVMPNLNLEYPVLREANPAIIHVSQPAFGSDGPYQEFISMGPGVDAYSGLSELTGYADGPPMKPGNYYADYMNGLMASHCILAGLFARAETGRGQRLESAMREVETHAIGEALLDYTLNGRAQTRQGNRHPSMAPHNVYPCLGDDMWVAIAVEDDGQWQALCRAMGSPAWAADPAYASVAGRLQRQDELDRLLAGWTREQDHLEVMVRLQEAGVPAGAVLQPQEMLEDPQLKHRGFYRDVLATGMRTSSVGWQFATTPMPVTSLPPDFGQDNDWVLRGLLGLTGEEIEGLKAKGIVAYGLAE